MRTEKTLNQKSEIAPTTVEHNQQLALGLGLIDLALVSMTVIWGANYVIHKLAFQEIAPLAFMPVRFALGSLLLVVLLAVRERSVSLPRADLIKVALAGFAGTTIYQPLFVTGLSLSTASNTAMILASTPAFIALLNRVLGRERLDWRGWAGIACAFLGILLIVTSSGTIEFGSATLKGDLLILAATFCWSLYAVISAPLLQTHSPLKVTALSNAFGTLPLIVICAPAILAQDWGRATIIGWGAIGYSSLLALVVAYIIWNLGVRQIGGARTALYNNLTPVFAAITAALLLGETITPLKILGAIVIFAGLYLSRTGNLVMEPEA